MKPEVWSAIAAWVTAAAAIIALLIAKRQLRKMGDGSEVQTVQMFVHIDAAITEAIGRAQNAAQKLSELKQRKRTEGGVTDEQLSYAEKRLNAETTGILNAVDRLAGCLLRNKRLEEIYKQDYFHSIISVVDKYPDKFHGPRERFKNLRQLYKKWTTG